MKNSEETEKEIQKVITDTINLIEDYDQKLIELNKQSAKEAKRHYLFGVFLLLAFIAAIFIALKFY